MTGPVRNHRKAMDNLLSCHTVADYFLIKVDYHAGDSISNLKLQKLCYYAQAWHLAFWRKPMFAETIEAWAHGQAIPNLYQRFKHYRWGSIDPQDLVTEPLNELAAEHTDFLDQVWAKYGRFSGRQLELKTHSEAPWKDAYGNTPRGGRCTAEITHRSMRDYYHRKLKNAA